MQLTQKQKGRLVAVLFILIMILPACYALIREYKLKKTEPKAVVPAANTETK